MKYTKLALFFAMPAIALLGACSNSVQDLPSSEGSTFLVSQLSASSELVPDSTIPAIKEANFLHVKACIRDVAVQSPVVGEEFEVTAPEQVVTLHTDGEGCIAWSQAMVFPWLSNEAWLKQEITIKATGHHLGAVNIPIYFNPWREGTSSLVDARYHQPAGPVTDIEELKSRAQISREDDDSPLSLSNISWSLLRRRGRGDQTILEWRLEATPVFERTDLDGQTQRDNLASGRGELSLQLEGSDLAGMRTQISDDIHKSITWQGGQIRVEGEMAVATELLPRLGDLSQLRVTLNLPGALPSVTGLITLNGVEAANSSELQPADSAEDISVADIDQTRANDVIGKLDISNVKVLLDNDDLEGYLLDENLQLSLTKAFRIEFNPTVILPGSNIMGSAPVPLTQGKVTVRAHLYAPEKAGVSYEQPDLSQFILLSSSEETIEVRPDGMVSKLFKFPMAISRTPLLRLKDLLVLEIIPQEGAQGVSAETFASEFYPLAESNQVTAFVQSDNSELLSSLPLPKDIDRRGLLPRQGGALDGLRYTLKQRAARLKQQFVEKKLSQVSAVKIDSKVARLAGVSTGSLSTSDLRVLMSSRKLPRQSLAKLCNEFFAAPTIKREFSWGTFSDKLSGGEQWRACIAHPENYLQSSPSDHMESFLKPQKVGDVTVTKPKFISQARGDIFRGVGFFASYGDRTSEGEGERTAHTVDTHLGFNLSIPFIATAGIGGEQSYSVYQAREKAQMQSSFERHYTQQKDIELEYNRITLEFLARMRRCLSVSSEQARKTMLICEDNNRLARARENWYFVGDTRLNKVGVITNATLPGDVEMAQILRGESSFKQLWGEFRQEDRALILEKLDGEDQGVLKAPITEQLQYKENPVGIGFPSVIIPY